MIYMIRCVLIFLLCQVLSVGLSGQSKIYKRQELPTLETVRSIMDQNPEEAVRLLDIIVKKSTANQDISTTSQAYELLGDISATNDLYEEAIKRYVQANDYAVILNSKARIAMLNRKIGETYVSADSPKSKAFFEICMNFAVAEDLYYSCYEGYGDGLKLQDSLERAIVVFQEIEEKYLKDSNPSLARIQAKIAELFAIQLKIDKALYNYSNAQSNYKVSNPKDDEVIRNSSENIILNQVSVKDEIDLRNSNIDFYANRPEKVAEEKIQLADAYVRNGKPTAADLMLNEIRPMLNVLPLNTKAEYFKKSSEIESSKGNFEVAIKEYKEYVKFRDSILFIKENALNQKLQINDLQSEVDISAKEYINERERIAYQRDLVQTQSYIIALLALLLLGFLISFLLIYKNVRARKKANKLLELRSLRSAMNPHFIFNALGSVNNFIAEKDTKNANKYLSEFSKLMRSVLDMNQQDLVPLKEELALSELYLKLEHGRWSDKFNYIVDLEEVPEDLLVPPLLVQPYIENAVWHGLRYKESFGHLRLVGKRKGDSYILEILDDGIGRTSSEGLKTKNQKLYQSTGIKNTQRRTELINDIYGRSYFVQIDDLLPDQVDTGTRVRLELN